MSRRLGAVRTSGDKCFITGTTVPMTDVKHCAKACGSHFFDPGAMRFFASRLPREAYADGRGGAYFVTSEKFEGRGRVPDGARLFSIRHFSAQKCSIDTLGKFQQHRSLAAAKRVAQKIAAKSRTRKLVGLR